MRCSSPSSTRRAGIPKEASGIRSQRLRASRLFPQTSDVARPFPSRSFLSFPPSIDLTCICSCRNFVFIFVFVALSFLDVLAPAVAPFPSHQQPHQRHHSSSDFHYFSTLAYAHTTLVSIDSALKYTAKASRRLSPLTAWRHVHWNDLGTVTFFLQRSPRPYLESSPIASISRNHLGKYSVGLAEQSAGSTIHRTQRVPAPLTSSVNLKSQLDTPTSYDWEGRECPGTDLWRVLRTKQHHMLTGSPTSDSHRHISMASNRARISIRLPCIPSPASLLVLRRAGKPDHFLTSLS